MEPDYTYASLTMLNVFAHVMAIVALAAIFITVGRYIEDSYHKRRFLHFAIVAVIVCAVAAFFALALPAPNKIGECHANSAQAER